MPETETGFPLFPQYNLGSVLPFWWPNFMPQIRKENEQSLRYKIHQWTYQRSRINLGFKTFDMPKYHLQFLLNPTKNAEKSHFYIKEWSPINTLRISALNNMSSIFFIYVRLVCGLMILVYRWGLNLYLLR